MKIFVQTLLYIQYILCFRYLKIDGGHNSIVNYQWLPVCENFKYGVYEEACLYNSLYE